MLITRNYEGLPMRLRNSHFREKKQQVWITYGSAMQIDSDSTEKSLFECTAKIADLAKAAKSMNQYR